MQRQQAIALRPALCALGFACLLAAAAAPAQTVAAPPWSAGDDVVTLRDGTTLAGRAIDVHRGDQLTLQLRGGGLRVVLWSELRDARGPGFAPSGPARAADARVPIERAADSTYDLPSPLEPRAGSVPVRLLSAGDALDISGVRESWLALDPSAEMALDSIAAVSSSALGELPGRPAMRDAFNVNVHLRRLCTTPCTLYLPPGRRVLHVGGPGRVATLERISIDRRGELVLLHSASATQLGAGVALTVCGAVGGVLGGVTLLLMATSPTSAATPTYDPSLPIATGVALGTAAVALAVGIPLLVASRTGVARSAPMQAGVVRF